MFLTPSPTCEHFHIHDSSKNVLFAFQALPLDCAQTGESGELDVDGESRFKVRMNHELTKSFSIPKPSKLRYLTVKWSTFTVI